MIGREDRSVLNELNKVLRDHKIEGKISRLEIEYDPEVMKEKEGPISYRIMFPHDGGASLIWL
jgi:hypothetical protein